MSTLTTLPLAIQSRILSYLCTHEALHPRTSRWKPPFQLSYRDPPITISLSCAETLTIMLPGELLSPAQASPVLAAAAAKLLASRVSFLTTCNTGDRLAAWVTAFAPYVKAVSTWDPFYNWCLYEYCLDELLLMFERQLQSAMRLLKAISIDTVRLEVLDLADTPFAYLRDMEDDLVGGLCAALESNAATLRELALPAFRSSSFTEKALEMCTLKKLEVLSVKLLDVDNAFFWDNRRERSGHPLMSMIRAVDGHADRSRKLSTLRELRLMGVTCLPSKEDIMDSDRSAGVAHAIKTLRIGIDGFAYQHHDLNVPFLSLFKNLERLFWNGFLSSNDTRLEELCTKLSEVHFCKYERITRSAQAGATEPHLRLTYVHSRPMLPRSEISVAENASSRAIRTVFADNANRTTIRNMITSCPNLEYLSLFVRPKIVASLGELLRSCEQVKGLELRISGTPFRYHAAEAWRSLSRIIPQSHKNLCHLAIVECSGDAVTCVAAAIDCLEQMVKAVGARAKQISFRVVVTPRRNATILEGICRLLNTITQSAPGLEGLELDFPIRSAGKHTSDYDEWNWDEGLVRPGDHDEWNWDEGLVRRLLYLRNQLLWKVQSLRVLDLGIWHGLSKPLEWNDGMLRIATEVSGRESDDMTLKQVS